jgi:hypothetical protein
MLKITEVVEEEDGKVSVVDRYSYCRNCLQRLSMMQLNNTCACGTVYDYNGISVDLSKVTDNTHTEPAKMRSEELLLAETWIRAFPEMGRYLGKVVKLRRLQTLDKNTIHSKLLFEGTQRYEDDE